METETKLNPQRFSAALNDMLHGHHGHFCAKIAEAYSVADSKNAQRLVYAFRAEFRHAYEFVSAGSRSFAKGFE